MGPRSIPGTKAGFLESIPYGGVPCSALMQGWRGGGLVLSQLNILGFVDFPWEEWMGDGLEGGRGKWEEGREKELWLVCRMNKNKQLEPTVVGPSELPLQDQAQASDFCKSMYKGATYKGAGLSQGTL